MPRIMKGYWGAGVGGGIASIGKLSSTTPIRQWENAGGTVPLNDRGDFIFQQASHLERFNPVTGEYDPNFDAQGSFSLAAGKDVYTASFFDGVRVSNQGAVRYFNWGVGDVSPYSANVILLEPNGTVSGTGEVFAAGSIQALEGGSFIALDGQYRPVARNGATAPVALPGRIGGMRVHGDLCCYHAQEQNGRIIIQKRDELIGVVVADGIPKCYRPDFEEDENGDITLMYAEESSEAPWQLKILHATRAQFAPLKEVKPPDPIPEEEVGPRSEPVVASPESYDLLPYIIGDTGSWPRKGPTHPMHQVIQGNAVFFVKFGTDLPAPYVPGEAYEMWAWDANWIMHLEDASAEPYSFADKRWYPRVTKIGQQFKFQVNDEIQYHRRHTCERWRTDPAGRRTWVHAYYPAFYWGKDLGTRKTLVVAYDPTGGVDLKNRSVELGFYALGAGSVRWESYHGDQVYTHGWNGPAQFPESARWARSDFYLFGGPALLPKRTGCVGDTIPHYPPFDPNPPKPQPEPEPKPYRIHTKGLKMDINGKTVVLRGPGGRLGRPDNPNTGIWAGENKGWRGMIWDGSDKNDSRYHHVATKVENSNYAIVHKQNNGLLGADATKHSSGLDKQFYYKPDGNTDRGGYETMRVYDGNENGAIQAQVEYNNDEGKYFSASVAVEVV